MDASVRSPPSISHFGLAMTRKALLWILGAAWLQLCHAASATGVPEAQADAFMRKSGLWQQLAEIEPGVQQGIAQSDAELRQLNDEQLERLREAGRTAYGADRLRSVMRGFAAYAGRVDSESQNDAKARLNRYRDQMVTALGRRMAAHSAVIYAPLSDDDLVKYIEFLASPAGEQTNNAASAALDKVLA